MVDILEQGIVLTIEEVIARRPSWVQRQISSAEAKVLAGEIIRTRAEIIGEIGVASGFSSAVLYAAARHNTKAPSLYAYDLSESCYFDKKHKTGEAFSEMLGSPNGLHLQTGLTSAEISVPSSLDFVFIDANHHHPWPALDFLSFSRSIKLGAVVALHDVEIVFRQESWARKLNGPRDLFRTWRGEKWSQNGSNNLAFIRFDPAVLSKSLQHCFAIDWDIQLSASQVDSFIRIAESLDDGAALAETIWESHKASLF